MTTVGEVRFLNRSQPQVLARPRAKTRWIGCTGCGRGWLSISTKAPCPSCGDVAIEGRRLLVLLRECRVPPYMPLRGWLALKSWARGRFEQIVGGVQ